MKVAVYINNNNNPSLTGSNTFAEEIINSFSTLVGGKHKFVFIISDHLEPTVCPNNIECYKIKDHFPQKQSKVVSQLRLRIASLIKKICEKVYIDIPIKYTTSESYDEYDKYLKDREIAFERIVDIHEIDIVLYSTMFDYPSVNIPFIQIIWDVASCQYPYLKEFYQNDNVNRHYDIVGNAAKRAFRVITGNKVGAIEIHQFYRIPEDRIRCIPFSVPKALHCIEEIGIIVPEPYILYPSGFWKHKNHQVIIKAIAKLKENNIILHAVFTGPDNGNTERLTSYIEQYGINEQVHCLGLVSNEELKYLYKNAEALVFPSILGPNNFPPIEALSLGCLPIISDIPGHREQMGEHALYFDPFDHTHLADLLYKILQDTKLKDNILSNRDVLLEHISSESYVQRLMDVVDEYELYTHL